MVKYDKATITHTEHTKYNNVGMQSTAVVPEQTSNQEKWHAQTVDTLPTQELQMKSFVHRKHNQWYLKNQEEQRSKIPGQNEWQW